MTTDSYRKCAKCGLTPLQNNSVSYYRFPKAGLQASTLKATAWATYCWPEKDWSSVEALNAINKKHKVLCGRHFEDYCYTDSSKRKLSKYSVPGTRDYVIKTMQVLRAKIFKPPNNSNSSGTPVTGCSTQPETIVGRTEYMKMTFGVPIHRFPNPEKHPDLFTSWVTIIGKKLEEIDPKKVYNNKRICDHHFDPIHKISGGRLKPKSIPSINLYGMLPTYTTFTNVDHCYSHIQRESLPPKPVTDVRKPCTDVRKPCTDVRKSCTRFNAGTLTDQNFRDTFQNDHSYDKKVTIITPTRGNKKVRVKIEGKTCSAVETQDSETASGKDAEGIVKTENNTEEPSAIDDDFAPPSPVPEGEGSGTLFSWQQSELIPADDVQPLTVAELEEQTGISLYCDDNPAQAVPQVPEASVKEVEYRCNDCGEIIDGFQFWCVQCIGCALCGACEARGEHKLHYVLRAPPHRPYKQTQVVLATIRHQLQNENLLTQLGPDDDGVKLEVKEEPPEEDCSVVTHDDPLDAADPLRHEPLPDESHHTTAAEETERPFKRPRLADFIESNFTDQVKLSSIPKPHENIPVNSDHVADQVGYAMEKLETARPKPRENIRITSDNAAGQVGYVIEVLKIAKRKPPENIRINDMHIPVEHVVEELKTAKRKPHENIRMNSDDETDQVEYVMEELETAKPKPRENIRINDMDDQVEYVMEELETARAKPNENIRINSDDEADDVEYVMEEFETARPKPNENIRTNSDDVDYQVEYLMEELETDDEAYVVEALETDDETEFTEIEHLDDEFTDSVDSRLVDDDIDFRINETDTRIVNRIDNRIGAESILSDLPHRGLRRNIIGNNRLPMSGSPESMARSLSTEAVVELRPLSSLEIRKWTADAKTRRK